VIFLTEKAISKIKEISESEGIGYNSVRIKLIPGGCAGFSNDLNFDDQYHEDLDFKLDCNDGVIIIIDQIAFHYLENSTIDYVESLISEGFKFNVPKATTSCGCGSSVSFE
jgi:iron-sulfur cluster insertion protein